MLNVQHTETNKHSEIKKKKKKTRVGGIVVQLKDTLDPGSLNSNHQSDHNSVSNE